MPVDANNRLRFVQLYTQVRMGVPFCQHR
jgi:hypothetical protein